MIHGIKLDEDLSPMVAKPLLEAGFAASTVVQQGLSGFGDEELWQRVVAEGYFLITADKGFADIRLRPPGSHPGILLLRSDRESIVDYASILSSVLSTHDLHSLTGTITVATRNGIRIRRP